MVPNRLVVRAFLWRSACIWIGARALLSAAFLFAALDPIHLPPIAIAQIVFVTVVLCLIDVHRRHERALLGNLAVDYKSLMLLFSGPAIVGEFAIQFVVRATS